jgi:hypothetical protein
MRNVQPQLTPAVEVLTLTDDGEATTGAKRNELLARSKGVYSVFVDDDDVIADNFVAVVLGASQSDPDAIGYWVERWRDGKYEALAQHTHRNSKYGQSQCGKTTLYQRTINHICPIRTKIARQVPFADVSIDEDTLFASQIKPFIRSETFIDAVCYYYLQRSSKASGAYDVLAKGKERPFLGVAPTI